MNNSYRFRNNNFFDPLSGPNFITGNQNDNGIVGKKVPKFSLDDSDKKGMKLIHHASIWCVAIVIISWITYFVGLILFSFGLPFWLSFGNIWNTTGNNITMNQGAFSNGWFIAMIIGVVLIFLTIIIRIIRYILEFKIVKYNELLTKYDDELNNNIIKRYMYLARTSKYLLFLLLARLTTGTMIDLWLIKFSKKVLNYPKLTPEEENIKEQEWIKKFVNNNLTDPRIVQAINSYNQDNFNKFMQNKDLNNISNNSIQNNDINNNTLPIYPEQTNDSIKNKINHEETNNDDDKNNQ